MRNKNKGNYAAFQRLAELDAGEHNDAAPCFYY